MAKSSKLQKIKVQLENCDFAANSFKVEIQNRQGFTIRTHQARMVEKLRKLLLSGAVRLPIETFSSYGCSPHSRTDRAVAFRYAILASRLPDLSRVDWDKHRGSAPARVHLPEGGLE